MGLRVFFQGHWSLITILYSFTFFPLHVTQLNRNSNLLTTDKHDVRVYTHKFTRTLLLLHLCILHTEPISSQFSVKFSVFLETNSRTNFPRISKYSSDECPTTLYTVNERCSLWTLHGSRLFSPLTHTFHGWESRWHWNWNNRNEFEARKRIVYPFATLILGYVPMTRT